MLLRQGGAQRGHRAVKPRLVEGDGVHVPLRQNDPARLGALGDVQGEQVPALVVHRGVRRVEVFGGGVVHHPPAEADHVPPHIDDGEDHPVAEAVVDAAVLVVDGQPRVQQVPLVIALARQLLDQRVPPVGGEAQPEPGQRPPGQPPALEVGQALRPLGPPEPPVKGQGGLPVHLQDLLSPLLGPGGGPPRLRDRHTGPLGQHLHRVPEGQVLQLHHIVDDAAPLATAEALVHLPVGHHVEGGSLLRVEGATAPIAVPLLGQPDRLRHQVDNIGPGDQLVQKLCRNGHLAPSSLTRGRKLSLYSCPFPRILTGFPQKRAYYSTVQPLGMNSSLNRSTAKGSVMPAM